MPTLSGLRAIVRRDPALNSTDVISDADLNTLLAEAAIQFARDGHPFIVKVSWNTGASTSEYVLSGDTPKVTGFLDLYWPMGGVIYAQTSTNIKFMPTDFTVQTEQWLNREVPGWKSYTASDTLLYVYLGYNSSGYAVLGTVPAASTTTPQFTVWAISSGTAMDGDTKYPYVNSTVALAHLEPYTKAIAYWASYVLHRDITHLSEESERFLGLYSSLAEACREAQLRAVTAEVHSLRQQGMMWAAQSIGSL